MHKFVTTPFSTGGGIFPDSSKENLRVSDFPGSGTLTDPQRWAYPQYEIVHFVGYVHLNIHNNNPYLLLDHSTGETLQVGALRDALVAAQTRLMILHIPVYQTDPSVPSWEANAMRLAELLVGGGVPAVLTVIGNNATTLDEYFSNLYANVVHNRPLPKAAKPGDWPNEQLNVRLFYGSGAKDALQFSRWIDDLRDRLKTSRTKAKDQADGIKTLKMMRDKAIGYLHDRQLVDLDSRINKYEDTTGSLTSDIDHGEQELNNVIEQPWDHESEGAVPLSQIAETIEKIEDLQKVYHELSAEMSGQRERAPRVLNANFGDPTEGIILEPQDGLVAGHEYDLLVDVGPRWDKVKSLVKGNAEFPEKALPPSTDGYVVQVVVVSDDFLPHLSTRNVWIPSNTGRSFPHERGERAAEPGPVALRLRAPLFPQDGIDPVITARARLFLYYENNLLQSAQITVGVIRAPGSSLEKDNEVKVDFVLTNSFQELKSRFAERSAGSLPGTESTGHPITVQVTLNDDGAGGHRILVKDQPDLPPGWAPFDPVAINPTLKDARNTLLGCFFKKDERNGNILKDAQGNGIYGLDANNGKTRTQFLWDLMKLAELGGKLFNMAFGQVNPEGTGRTQAEWSQQLRKLLTKRQFIQVARIESLPAQFVFPWALIYEYPLTGPSPRDYKWCDVINEWSAEGLRDQPLSECCPYLDKVAHQENILCPYGFWGLKHIIEQPPSVLQKRNGTWELREALNQVHIGQGLDLAIGLTRDRDLNQTTLEAHLRKLAQIQNVRFDPPDPADDFAKVRAMLHAPQIAYFLCHGEYDAAKSDSYLSVGFRDNDPVHRIYLNNIYDWASTTAVNGLNLAAWKKHRPLVFINGCHTTNLAPGEILNFVSAFAFAGASGVVGTEVSVVLPVATEVAESLFKKITQPIPARAIQPIPTSGTERISVGEAMHQIRWDLANKGNLLGLAYTLYCLANLHLVSDGQ